MSDVYVYIDGFKHRIGDGRWLTISAYCKKYDLSLSRVLTWISRGIVMDNEVLVVSGLNDLRLIWDIDYSVRVRKYSARK